MIANEARRTDPALSNEYATTESAVSWAAILGGAAAAAALSLILLMLGAGLGMSSVSPWSQQGVSAGAFGIGAAIWICVMQAIASGMGGYLAGRLRTKWVGAHTDEVYFRDTAHGFMAWAVATLVTAAVLTSAIGGILGAGASAGGSLVGAAGTAATAAGAGAAAGGGANGSGYFVDSLFRKDPSAGPSAPSDPAASANSAGEVGRIFAESLRSGALAPDDASYIASLVAQRTGMAQPDALKKVNDSFAKLKAGIDEATAKAKEAADAARKAAAYATLWLFISLLIGAFCASLAATIGGRRRDL